jgi:hypothetical protein
VVTFTYDDYSRRDTPFNARIYRVRDDLSWQEVVERYLHDTPHAHALPLNGIRFLFLFCGKAIDVAYSEIPRSSGFQTTEAQLLDSEPKQKCASVFRKFRSPP